MEIKKLLPYVISLIVLAAIVLMSMAITDTFSQTLRTDTTITLANLTLPAENATDTLSSYPYLQDITLCYNGTDLMPSTAYTVGEGDEDGGTITVNEIAGDEYGGVTVENCSIQYLAENTAQAAADKFTTGLAIFATFVGILALAIMGMFIMGVFKKKEN